MSVPLRLVQSETTQRERAPDLRDAVADTVAAMTWLKPSDDGMKSLALRFAEEIEKAVDRAEELDELFEAAAAEGDRDLYRRVRRLEAMCDVSKTVGWLGPQLQNALHALGGSPTSRRSLTTDKPVGSRLAQLRDAAGKHASARVDDAEDLDAAAD